jgi:hypothetical protein
MHTSSPVRTTDCAPALPPAPSLHTARASGSTPPEVGSAWKAGRFAGRDCALQPDGTLRCPADQKLTSHEQRREADGGLRVVDGASIQRCRLCPLREQCQWNGGATTKPRQVRVPLHPLAVGSDLLLWRDWSRREHRRACMQFVQHHCIEMSLPPPAALAPCTAHLILSRAQRARSRPCWPERLARHARVSSAGQVTIKRFGVPERFATSFGLASA